ncbi:hypothetical protein HYT18_01840 [Candidatus Microgenomates bacterium]|nr:hypothetical protein [Candidatus Microgenomates bacterium]
MSGERLREEQLAPEKNKAVKRTVTPDDILNYIVDQEIKAFYVEEIAPGHLAVHRNLLDALVSGDKESTEAARKEHNDVELAFFDAFVTRREEFKGKIASTLKPGSLEELAKKINSENRKKSRKRK